MIIGGIAASLLGRARTTLDVDVVVWIDDEAWPAFIEALGSHGIEPRISDALEFARRSRVLLLRHAKSGVPIDISLGALPFEQEAIDRAVSTKVGKLEIPLVTPEDLVILKAVAHRPHDLTDIEGIVAMHPALDLARVRRWVEEFATALEMPELWTDLARVLRQMKRPRASEAARKARPRGLGAAVKKSTATKRRR